MPFYRTILWIVGDTPPTTIVIRKYDIWIDTTNKIMKIWDGTTWLSMFTLPANTPFPSGSD